MNPKFNPAEKVVIPDLENQKATVAYVRWNGFYFLYNVEYFYNGKLETSLLYEYQIGKINGN